MQVDFAYAAFSATAVVLRNAWHDSSAGTGGAAAKVAARLAGTDVQTDVHSGHDDENGKPHLFSARAAKGTRMTAVPVVMTNGMQLARARTGASAVFVTSRRARVVAIFHNGASRQWGSLAGLTEAARSDAAFSANPGSEDGMQKGVMTRDASMVGREAIGHSVVANVTGS
ncbi:hypothetical protein ACFPTO_07655 [Paraburkholderia denitrificans]|uniref:Uncharacterized protein n=1 Tax=Paraburkholderia denitrificans TaxID=694025 RepID=A0ABW0J6X6_9BURK